MKLQSLLLGSLLIVAGGLAACSPGNSVSVPTCSTPGCVPAGTVTTTPQTPTPGLTAPPNAVVVAIGSGTVTVTPPPALGFPAGTTVTFNGSNGGGPVYVTPFSTTAPAGATIPTGSTFVGTTSIYNPSTGTGFSATSATITLPIPTGVTVASGSTCVIAVQPNGTGTAVTAPATLSGNTLTATIAPAGGLGIAPGFFDVVYAYCTPPGASTATATPLPNSAPTTLPANTPVTITAGQFGLPANTSVTITTTGGTVNVVPFSTTAPAAAVAPAGVAGQQFGGQITIQNPGNSGITSTQAGTLKLGTGSIPLGYTCTLYSSVNGGQATSTGLTGTTVSANATGQPQSSSVTFNIPQNGVGLTGNTYVTLLTYCAAPATPAALASPTAFAAPQGNGTYAIPATNVTNAPAGTGEGGNLSLNLPAGTTLANALTAATISGAGAITSTPTPTGLGIPTYDGTTATATSAFGGTPVAYGSFVFQGTTNPVGANQTNAQTNQTNVVYTIPNLFAYQTANPTKNYILIPYDPSSGKYQTAPFTSPYTGSQVTPTITATNATTGNAGTPGTEVSSGSNVNFVTTSQTVFQPGVTYGYVIVAN